MAGNAVNRFWQARQFGDWDLLAAQLRPGVTIQMVHGEAEMSREEFLTFLRLMHHDATTKVHRTVTGRGLQIAVLASVTRPNAKFECAGFYDLREGRIEMLREIWLPRDSTSVLDLV